MKKSVIFCAWMGVLKFLRIARPIYISYHFVIIHMGVNHRMWATVRGPGMYNSHIYTIRPHVCAYMKTHMCPKSAYVCDMHDTRVVLNLWVTCTVAYC